MPVKGRNQVLLGLQAVIHCLRKCVGLLCVLLDDEVLLVAGTFLGDDVVVGRLEVGGVWICLRTVCMLRCLLSILSCTKYTLGNRLMSSFVKRLHLVGLFSKVVLACVPVHFFNLWGRSELVLAWRLL